jgi:tetratricopeptide (TPR) repeat protein
MLAASTLLTSCSLDTETYDFKDDDNAVTSLTDVRALMNGCYNTLGDYEFLGNYAVSLSDFVSGMSTGSSSSGHMYSYSAFTFSDTEGELADLWGYGYKIAANATTAINKCKEMMADGTVTESEYNTAYSYMAQCYALKAMAFYYMVNYFGLPYSSTNASTDGIVIYDTDVPSETDQVSRSTVGETYDQIQKDLDSATVYIELAGSEAPTEAYYLGIEGIEALKANVYLSLGDYSDAETSAKAALAAKYGSAEEAIADTLSTTAYVNMWGQTTEQTEDLFTIKKSSDDNLSANALNTLYGSYYCTIQNSAISKLGSADIRRQVLRDGDGGGISSIKFDGQAEQATSNIPIYRKSEMTLIIAECAARLGDLDEAKDYLFYTARRDLSLQEDDLPTTASELLTFINDERVREFFQEGKRFFNARRTGEIISGDNFSDWDVSKFVFPIPSNEVNAGFGVTQNENWSDNLPSLTE